jgi:hypothetical protein
MFGNNNNNLLWCSPHRKIEETHECNSGKTLPSGDSNLCTRLKETESPPVTVTAQHRARNIFARIFTGIVGSNPTRGINDCPRPFCVCIVLYS